MDTLKAVAASAGDQIREVLLGTPVEQPSLWAALHELSTVALLDQRPAPQHVGVFLDVPEFPGPVLYLEFARDEDAIGWCDWFGLPWDRRLAAAGLPVAARRWGTWRGYTIQITRSQRGGEDRG